ncbi:MAG: PstS family phosphate ABC transporter substrate-binding protein [Bdellovibrionales bacterium]|nr:PstS family phosphate ABC transporter substrate-binding protein [Bdellovibrionales bacterium]
MRNKLLTITGALFLVFSAGSVSADARDNDIIQVDGSSTVYPITEAVAEEFGSKSPKTKITVGVSGTGGGFKKFCVGETDISDASRPIKQKEIDLCKENKVDYVELPVAYDALSVVVNPQNNWVSNITVAELKKIWEPAAQGKITHWNQIRADWPNEKIYLFGPGVDSGTFDYFTEVINGEGGASRGDYTSSEDDNVLVQGISSNKYALGYFGLAYYVENQSKLKALGIDDGDANNGNGAQMPTIENVVKDVYKPLARPLFIYISKNSLDTRPVVQQFVSFYMNNASELASEVGYIRSPDEIQKLAQARLEKQVTGTVFADNTSGNMTLAQLMKKGL